MQCFLRSACWILLATSVATASPMTATTQLRRITASASASDGASQGGSPTQTITAPGLDSFDEHASADITVSNGLASGSADQQSDISGYSFFATGSWSATAVHAFGDPGYANAAGDNEFRVYFTLTESVDYSLFGFAQKQDRADVTIELKEGGFGGATIDRFLLSEFGSQTYLPYSVQGTLPAGDYILYAWTNGYCAYVDEIANCSGSYDLSFIISEATGAPAVAPAAAVAVSPNPFRESTRLRLPEGARTAAILDAAGRLVAEVRGDVVWDGRDAAGRSVPSGVYFVRAEGVAAPSAKVVRVK